MGLIIERAVRRIEIDGSTGPPRPLAAYRETPAWVLLGDPGAGKTTAFEVEARDDSEPVHLVSARDFLAFKPANRPEWRGRTLLLDGLDEVRAGSANAGTPFDAVRARLDGLGKPRFRISCREADWLGNNDRERLKAVSPNGAIVVLRLDPLTGQEVHDLVSDWLGDSDPAAFFKTVSDRGLSGLLRNPQNLDLLLRVFRESGTLPASRLETFEQASNLLAQERNAEREIGGREVPVKSVLEAAGRLCAVQLLSDFAGHCLSERDAIVRIIPISAYGSEQRDDILAALRTRLFAADGERHFRPAHAHLAAFLAARHLAGLAPTVPASRILGLLAGHDGAPPTSLRGLVAWLAAISPELRKPLIERDPAAVLAYGDVRAFTPEEKEHLLDAIGHDLFRIQESLWRASPVEGLAGRDTGHVPVERLRGTDRKDACQTLEEVIEEAIGHDPFRLHESPWPVSAVEALAGPDMERALLKRLEGADRSDTGQKVLEVVVDALRHTPPKPLLTDELRAISLDTTRPNGLRSVALRAWIRHLDGASDRISRLRECLVEIHEPSREPVDGELLVVLLESLYPEELSASEIWDYFPSNPDPGYPVQAGEYWRELSRNCPDADLPEHLDRLVGSMESLRPALDRSLLREVPVRLLARGLQVHGDTVERSRLLRWFGILIHAYGEGKLIEEIRRWMEGRPRIHKAIIEEALRSDSFELTHFLSESTPPADIAEWRLEQAVSARTTDAEIAKAHLRDFVKALGDRPAEMDRLLVEARRRLRSWPAGIALLELGLKSDLPEGYFEHRIRWWHLLGDKKSPADTDLVEAVRRQAESLRENRARPALLHDLATILWDAAGQTRGDAAGRTKLSTALGGDRELVEAALAGITRAPDRDDLPSVAGILDLKRRDRMSLLEGPMLMGLTMRPPEEVLRLDENRLRTALAFRLNHLASGEDASWYRACLRERPALVAEVLTVVGRRTLSDRGHHSLHDLYHFAREEIYEPVAKRVTLPLLRRFPLRANEDQRTVLVQLLQSALVHCDDSEVRRLIDDRTALRSMDRSQRAYWFAAGIAIAPDEFGARFRETAKPETHATVLEAFYSTLPPNQVPRLNERLTPAVLEILIREIGTATSPLPADTISWDVGPALSVEGFIQRLSEHTGDKANKVLKNLADDGLTRWRSRLDGARAEQLIRWRDARYEAPTPEDVFAALRDGPPAGAGDLRELVVDRLERIAGEIRTTNANLWRQFWNEDTKEPKHENACRDALLALLRAQLPEGCDAQPEGQYAGNRRADIKVTSGEWNVPVEIKKNRHSDLWRAVRNQLLPRYANDPATEGLGIYLVLWFGARVTAVAESGRPRSPDALREHLLTELTPAERRRAAVLVMDVTPPHATAGDRSERSDGSRPGQPPSAGAQPSERRRPPGLPNEPAAGRRRVG